MPLMLNASAAFAVAAWFMGTSPFVRPLSLHWKVVAADLAAARPQAKRAQQVDTLFRSGTPHPDRR